MKATTENAAKPLFPASYRRQVLALLLLHPMARGAETAGSDVDVLIAGSVDSRVQRDI
jgi:hypothetical protein